MWHPRSSPLRSARLLLGTCLALAACSGSDGGGEYYTDWDRAGGCQAGGGHPWGLSLAGEPLGPCQFRGEFVWISYDALWCNSCRGQSRHTAEAMRLKRTGVQFVAVLSGGTEPFTAASDEQLRRWAGEAALDPRFVVSEGATSRTLPQHALIGPDGRTWYRYVGLLSSDAMLATVEAFRSGARQPVRFD